MKSKCNDCICFLLIIMKGLIHIYTGNGKGKTTAAVGLAVRGIGQGLKVIFVQFLKDNSSGEIAPLRELGITVRGLSKNYGFVSYMNDMTKNQVWQEQTHLLKQVLEESQQKKWDLVVLDEIMAAYQFHLLDEELMDCFVSKKPKELELVLTGRNAPLHWIEQAHYVTNMTFLKHPYQKGIGARRGVEY